MEMLFLVLEIPPCVQTRYIASLRFVQTQYIASLLTNTMIILGFDPGRDKCGVAVMGQERQLYYHQVVSSEEAIATVEALSEQFSLNLIVIGDQTTAKSWKKKIEQSLSGSIPIVMVDERYSSMEARDRYWQMYPPKGFKRLIPLGMQLPPRPIDDLVAILLIERYLQQSGVAE